MALIGCYKDLRNDLDNVLLDLLVTASPSSNIDFFKLPHHTTYSAIPQDPKNPITEAKVKLGKMLFYETGFSLESHSEELMMTFSCGTCHDADISFQSDLAQAIGDGGVGTGVNRKIFEGTSAEVSDIYGIRTPSLLNVAYQNNMHWNGEFGAKGENEGLDALWLNGTELFVNQLGLEGPEAQSIASIDRHRMLVNEEIITSYGYQKYFDNAFPEVYKPLRYNNETAGKALAAYQRTLTAYDAPFQKWLRGEYEEMLDVEKRGAILFFGKANCVNCHTGPALNSNEFHALGMKDLFQCEDEILIANNNDPVNLGRGGFTKNEDENYQFKVPQLYNLKDANYLGHGSSFTSIKDIIKYKNKAKKQNENVPDEYLSDHFLSLGLTDEEVSDLGYFIKHALYDPNISRYKPQEILSNFCFPNNDELSKQELGCN